MISSDTFSLTDAEQTRFARVQRFGAGGSKGVSELLEMLTDPSWVVRRSVVDALARFGDSAVAPLIDLLRHKRDNEARIAAVVDTLSISTGPVEKNLGALVNDADPAIVADVAQILGRRRSPTAVTTLVQLTKHTNDNVAVGAIEGLGRIGGRAAVEALIDIVGGRNFFRVFPAIDVLGRSGDPRSVGPLACLLTDPTYLPEASRALGRLGERSAIAPLVELLSSSSDAVVRVAAASLWELRERFQEKSGGDVVEIDGLLRGQMKKEMVRRLGRLLLQADSTEAVAICNLLGVVGDAEAAPALTAALEADGPVTTSAAAALKKIGRDADSTMLVAIRDGASERRKILLPLVSRTSAAIEVAACLSDSDPDIRALACDTLARLGNADVVDRLFPLLEDENLRVVHSATAAIQALGTRETRELAMKAAESKSAIVRRSALRILAYFGDAVALKPLLKGLTDSDPRVREAAIHGLPFVDDPAALKALYAAATSEVPRNRALAMRSLGQLEDGNEQVYTLLLRGLEDADPWTRYYSCQSLGRLKFVPASSAVTKLLNDQAGQVRVAAVEALSHFDSPMAHEALRRAASREDLEVRRAALVGLGLGKREEDLPVLLAAAVSGDPATKLMALSALSNFSSERALATLSSAASDPDDQVSTSAVTLLSSRREEEATEVLVELLSVANLAERARAALLVPTETRASGLLIALQAADHELAGVLISILSRLQRPEARVALLSAMKLNNVAARKAAAPVLAARRDREMTSILQEAAENDPDDEVRRICTLLLRQ